VIAGVAFCPHPPALLPDVGRGTEVELGELRAACAAAIQRIGALSFDQIGLVATGPCAAIFASPVRASLRRFGIDREVGYGSDAPIATDLPLGLLVGSWLLESLTVTVPVTGYSIASAGLADRSTSDSDRDPVIDTLIGAARSARLVLVVLGDGSARRTERAPGFIDERAAAFDDGVLAALTSGDPVALADLDADLGAELLAAGVPAWQAAAAAMQGGEFDAEVSYFGDPFGVSYPVATWIRRA
jgi:hypothetical protein